MRAKTELRNRSLLDFITEIELFKFIDLSYEMVSEEILAC